MTQRAMPEIANQQGGIVRPGRDSNGQPPPVYPPASQSETQEFRRTRPHSKTSSRRPALRRRIRLTGLGTRALPTSITDQAVIRRPESIGRENLERDIKLPGLHAIHAKSQPQLLKLLKVLFDGRMDMFSFGNELDYVAESNLIVLGDMFNDIEGIAVQYL